MIFLQSRILLLELTSLIFQFLIETRFQIDLHFLEHHTVCLLIVSELAVDNLVLFAQLVLLLYVGFDLLLFFLNLSA